MDNVAVQLFHLSLNSRDITSLIVNLSAKQSQIV